MQKFLNIIQKNFLTLFYIWYIPVFPWTFGSLFTFIVWIFFISFYEVHFIYFFFIAIIMTIISIFVIENYEKKYKKHDASIIVIDELIWMLLCLWIILIFTDDIFSLILGFIFFRILDMLKPSFIWYIDKNWDGGYWVVFDDFIAWIIAWFFSVIIFFFFNNYLLIKF